MEYYKIAKHRFIWACQRELQREVAQTWSKDENLPKKAALFMLFMLGFPCLRMEKVQDAEIWVQESQDKAREGSPSSSSNFDRSVDVSVQVWRVRTALAPQDTSLMIRLDSTNHRVSLRLQTSSDNRRFIWQDWIDAAMGFMKGAEMRADGDCGYGRQIVRADLRKSMVELCPLRVDGYGIEAVVKKTSTARVWLGWLAFDVKICKFEMEQWLVAYGVDITRELQFLRTYREIAQAEEEIVRTVSAEN